MANIQKIKSSGIFTNYIFKSIPLAFDESLSYYEVLCGVLNKLKTQEEVINNNADLLAELESYVNSYFDNLDVQEEINNKLDEMVTDGTLAEIINQEIFSDLNNQVTQNKNDIESLQTLTNNLPTDEQNIQKLQNFNEFTNKPLQYGKLNLPSEFSNIGFNLYRDINNNISDDLDLKKYDSNNILYVDYINGNDTTHTDNIFKTIKGALNYITTLSETNYKILCKTYRFSRDEFYNQSTAQSTYDMNKSIIIEPYEKDKTILVSTDERNLTWTKNGSLWTTTRSSVSKVYNLQKNTIYGTYEEFEKVSTLEECQSTIKTWYQSGSNLYIHTENEEEPTYDKYLITLSVSIINFNIQNNLFLRLKNIEFYPANRILFENNSEYYDNKLILENVKIIGTTNNNGFNIDNIKKCYLYKCVTGDNLRDGFNYHYTTLPTVDINNSVVYEKNCTSFNNGITDLEHGNNNCTSIHEGGRIIRVNGLYQNANQIVVADVDSSRTLMIHCKVNQNIDNYKAFNFQDEEGKTGIAYLIDCECLQKTSLSLTGTDNFDIRLKNFKGNYENPDLNITLYEE